MAQASAELIAAAGDAAACATEHVLQQVAHLPAPHIAAEPAAADVPAPVTVLATGERGPRAGDIIPGAPAGSGTTPAGRSEETRSVESLQPALSAEEHGSPEPGSPVDDEAAEDEAPAPRTCSHCRTPKTPLWRNGPEGPKSLCNACGVRFKLGKLQAALPEGAPPPQPPKKRTLPPALPSGAAAPLPSKRVRAASALAVAAAAAASDGVRDVVGRAPSRPTSRRSSYTQSALAAAAVPGSGSGSGAMWGMPADGAAPASAFHAPCFPPMPFYGFPGAFCGAPFLVPAAMAAAFAQQPAGYQTAAAAGEMLLAPQLTVSDGAALLMMLSSPAPAAPAAMRSSWPPAGQHHGP
jgi:hypothetical protein